jgi:hypothetical protein
MRIARHAPQESCNRQSSFQRDARVHGPLATALLVSIAMLFVSGCTTDRHQQTIQTVAATSPGDAPVRPIGQRDDGSLSARGVVAALALRGFLVPNLLDVTDQVCPTAGCEQSLVSDTVRVTSFSSPRAATGYAQRRGLRHWHNIVIAFPPVMAASERKKYWSAVESIFP